MINTPPSPSPDVTARNVQFWEELCGSTMARSLGITDASAASLARFDRAYFHFYPYLLGHIKPFELKNRRVVEIGLGYGTVGQRLLEAGATYTGVDVASGPTAMINHRARLIGLPECGIRGSASDLPLSNESVDCLISIGCFHHTGSVQQCIRETHRVLKPGGVAIVMLYNRFSYRQWLRWPLNTAWALWQAGSEAAIAGGSVDQRRRYDANVNGDAAPETVFLSIRQVKQIFAPFQSVEVTRENNSNLLRIISRRALLTTLGRTAGLDLYVRAIK